MVTESINMAENRNFYNNKLLNVEKNSKGACPLVISEQDNNFQFNHAKTS
jgi:hypothetical protein